MITVSMKLVCGVNIVIWFRKRARDGSGGRYADTSRSLSVKNNAVGIGTVTARHVTQVRTSGIGLPALLLCVCAGNVDILS